MRGSPCLFPAVEMNPRTLCACQPVASMISAKLAPFDRPISSRILAPLLCLRGPFFRAVFLAAFTRMFLEWLGTRADRDSLRQFSVQDIDGYLSWRLPRLRRATRHCVAVCLRSFRRYSFAEGLITRDLAPSVSGPILYQFDDIPRAFTREQVDAMLRAAGTDRSPLGLRDHAILLLLATYEFATLIWPTLRF